MIQAASTFEGGVSSWDTHLVKSMFSTFSYTYFNGDVSSWDVSKVFEMSLLLLIINIIIHTYVILKSLLT